MVILINTERQTARFRINVFRVEHPNGSSMTPCRLLHIGLYIDIVSDQPIYLSGLRNLILNSFVKAILINYGSREQPYPVTAQILPL